MTNHEAPAGTTPAPALPTATIDRSLLDSAIAELQALCDRITAAIGTASQVQTRRNLAALADAITDDQRSDLAPLVVAVTDAGDLAALAVAVQALDEWSAQQHAEAVTAITEATKPGEDLDALRTQYDDQRKRIDGLAAVLTSFGIDCSDAVIPDKPSKRSTSAGASRHKVKTFKQTFSKTLPTGTVVYPVPRHDRFSSFVWYNGADLVGKPGKGTTNAGKGMPAADVSAFLVSQGFDPNKPWSIVGASGTVYAMSLTGQDSDTADQDAPAPDETDTPKDAPNEETNA